MLEEYRENIDSEQVLLVLFVGIALYMFVESFTFHPDAGNFPRITSTAVILLGSVLLMKNRLPATVREYLLQEQTIAASSVGDEDVQKGLEESGEDLKTTAETLDRPIHPSLFTALVTVLYLIGGFLFGLFWVTPVFVVGYLRWFRQSWTNILIVVTVSMAAVYGFVEFLNMPFFYGALG